MQQGDQVIYNDNQVTIELIYDELQTGNPPADYHRHTMVAVSYPNGDVKHIHPRYITGVVRPELSDKDASRAQEQPAVEETTA